MHLHPTPSEQVLWAAIRGRRLGASFRRQVAMGPYIVNFLAPAERLIVEVDGGYHDGRQKANARRECWLRQNGYRVLRLPAALVLGNLESALAIIGAQL